MAATYTVKQVAQILGYSTNSIYTFLKEKRIRAVRVGRGRFRIPQAEIDRLLLTEKGLPAQVGKATAGMQVVASSPIVPQVLQSGVVEAPHEAIIPTGVVIGLTGGHVEVPSLFDWFVGMGSIVLGLAMFLFSRVYEEFAFEQFLAWMPAIRVSLIAAGFGLLLTDVVGRKASLWHKMFHWALIIGYVGYTTILIQTGNWEGVVIYGMLAAILLFTFFVGLGGIAGFALYVVAFLSLLPSVAVFAPNQSTLTGLIAIVPVPTMLLTNIWIALVLAMAFVVWLGYIRDRRVFWVGMLGVSIFLVVLSIHYAGNLAWGRSLFMLLLGLLSLFVPVWQTLTFTHKRDRAFVFGVFGSLLTLFVVVVGVLRIMQTNLSDYAGRELGNKVSYGKTLVTSTMMTTKTSLLSAAANALLVDSMGKENREDLLGLAKAVFEGSSLLRRISMVNADGAVLAEYPHEASSSGDFASRDYFVTAKTTKKPVVSDVYESASAGVKRKMVVVAVPVISKEQDVTGVIVGSLDLEMLGYKLQQIAATQTGEYFIVIDRAGRRVIHPDQAQIGLDVEGSDPMREALLGRRGVKEGYSFDGMRTLVAYDAIDDATGWAIGIKAPITEILQATNAATMTIFGVILISALVIGVFLLSHKTRMPPPAQGSRPEPRPKISDHSRRVTGALEKAAKEKRRSGRAREDTS